MATDNFKKSAHCQSHVVKKKRIILIDSSMSFYLKINVNDTLNSSLNYWGKEHCLVSWLKFQFINRFLGVLFF